MIGYNEQLYGNYSLFRQKLKYIQSGQACYNFCGLLQHLCWLDSLKFVAFWITSHYPDKFFCFIVTHSSLGHLWRNWFPILSKVCHANLIRDVITYFETSSFAFWTMKKFKTNFFPVVKSLEFQLCRISFSTLSVLTRDETGSRVNG